LRGLRRAEALAAAMTQTHVAEGPTVIEAVVDSDHSVDTVYDYP
jgi:acetolactate synthase regulatory subunit